MLDEISGQFGIPSSDNSNAGTAQETASSQASPETKIDDIFGEKPVAGGQPDAVKPQEPQATTTPGQAPKPGEAQPANSPPAVETDPAKLFAAGSQKAFYGQDGNLDTQKLSNYIVSGGKTFVPFYSEPFTAKPADKPADKPDPYKAYNDEVAKVIDNFDAVIQGEVKKGYTETEAIANVAAHFAALKNELQRNIDIQKAIDDKVKEFSPELEMAKEDRLQAAGLKNIADLSAPLENLIPGIRGEQVLNMFILDPKYGGGALDRRILRDNPGFRSLPAAEQQKVAAKWFKNFQQDRAEMAEVAELGRLRWMQEQFPAFIQHFMKMGATLAANKSESAIGSPSNVLPVPAKGGQAGALEKFFGYDAVN